MKPADQQIMVRAAVETIFDRLRNEIGDSQIKALYGELVDLLGPLAAAVKAKLARPDDGKVGCRLSLLNKMLKITLNKLHVEEDTKVWDHYGQRYHLGVNLCQVRSMMKEIRVLSLEPDLAMILDSILTGPLSPMERVFILVDGASPENTNLNIVNAIVDGWISLFDVVDDNYATKKYSE